MGALTPKFQINEVWNALHDSKKTVVVQIAPAVRVAIGEYFGYKPGTATTGQIITALRMMGFDQVYDTSFAADLTVLQEGDEFLERYGKQEKLPQFTSCCPAWVNLLNSIIRTCCRICQPVNLRNKCLVQFVKIS